MMSANQSEVKSTIALKLTRVFDASPERVFDAWLDPVQISRWLGPGESQVKCEAKLLEPRVGGRYHIVMHKPNRVTNTTGVYREIARPSRLVFTWTWDHDCGGSGITGHETLVTVTFRAIGKKTEMTLLHESFPTSELRDGHDKGWSCCFDQLAAFLSDVK